MTERSSVPLEDAFRRFLPQGLRYRLLGFFALSLVVPTLVTGALVTATLRRSLLDASLREQRELAHRIGDRVSSHIGNVKKALLAAAARIGSDDRRADSAALRQIMGNYPYIMECAVAGPDGRERVKLVRQGSRLYPSNSLVNRASRDEVRRPLRGETYVGPVFFTRRERIPQMFVSVPLAGQRALLARLSLDNVWELVSEVTVGKTGYAYIVDPAGNLVAHPQKERVLSHENRAGNPMVSEFLSGEADLAGRSPSRHIHADDYGKKALAVSYRVPDLGWGVVVQIPLREALSPVRAAGRRVAFGVFALGAAFLFIGLSLVRRILHPLKDLQEGVQKIGQGELRHRLDIRTGDEIEKLAGEFNAMAGSLERLESAKRDLTHMIVHDLKSPLSSILGSIEYILAVSRDSLSPEQKKLLTLGSKSGKDLLRLIQNLLDLAKMEEGKLELHKDSFSLLELAAECVDDMEPHIHRDKKIVSVEVSKNLPRAFADRDLVYRVLSNLLTNALKHTASGSEISIRAGLTQDQTALILSVKDNGDGIPKDIQAKIFDKFGQAEAKKQRFRVGAGLGLTFCKMAVDAHGGRIWVESEPGKGSEFLVQLPLPAATESAATAPLGSAAAAG